MVIVMKHVFDLIKEFLNLPTVFILYIFIMSIVYTVALAKDKRLDFTAAVCVSNIRFLGENKSLSFKPVMYVTGITLQSRQRWNCLIIAILTSFVEILFLLIETIAVISIVQRFGWMDGLAVWDLGCKVIIIICLFTFLGIALVNELVIDLLFLLISNRMVKTPIHLVKWRGAELFKKKIITLNLIFAVVPLCEFKTNARFLLESLASDVHTSNKLADNLLYTYILCVAVLCAFILGLDCALRLVESLKIKCWKFAEPPESNDSQGC